ncbi:MAG: cystathionine gamma-synthase family protein [Desulfurococcaceae archaeon]
MRDETIYSKGPLFEDPYDSGVFPIYTSVVYGYIDQDLGLAKLDDAGRVLKYGRESNPTVRYFEKVIATIEGAEDALAFSSGMAAITNTLLLLMKPGLKVIVPYEVYSATVRFLEVLREKAGVRYQLVWPSAEAILEAVDRSTSVVFLEVLTNPTVKVIDLESLVKGIDESVVIVVDSTFTTPIMLKPLKYGVTAVVHSVTKYIAGHNDVVGGVVASSKKLASELWEYRRVLGTIMSPFEAYLAVRGLKTLHLRFKRSCENARAVAEFLEDHPKVEEVYYPGLQSSPYHDLAKKLFGGQYYGGVLSFKVKASTYQDTVAFLSRLKVIRRSPSLGATETMAVLPYKSVSAFIPEEARRKLGITENLVRLSLGLENLEDILEDLAQALS